MQREFLRAAAARLFAVAASLGAGMASLKLYGNFFTPSAYGVIIVALQLIGYLPALDGGFRTATNRYLLAGSPSERRELVLFSQTIYSWLLLFGVVVSSILMLGYNALAHHRSGDAWGWHFFLVLGACGALSMFANAQAGLLLGLGAQATMSIITGVSALIGVAALALALHSGAGNWAFPASIFSSAASTYVLALLFLSRFEPDLPRLHLGLNAAFWGLFHRIRHDAWRAFRSQISILLLFSSDIILVSLFCRPADVAVYGVLSRIFAIARGFLQSFSEVAWPLIARRTHGYERFQDWLLRTNGWIYGLAAGVIIAIIPAFVQWYMGPEWRPPEILCWLFVLRFLVIGSSSPAAYFLLGAGDFLNIARCCEREMLTAVLLGAILGWFFGANGIALAFLLATNAGTFLPLWMIYARERNQQLAPLLARTWLGLLISFGLALFLASYALKFH